MSLFGDVLNIGSKVAGVVTGNPWIASAASAASNFFGQEDTNQTNQDIANNANATSIELANTAYQRKVSDLKAAGLNPALAYGGGGADTPNIQTARVENSAASASLGGLSGAQQALLSAQTLQSQKAAEVSSAQAANIQVDTAAKALELDKQKFLSDFGDTSVPDSKSGWAVQGESRFNDLIQSRLRNAFTSLDFNERSELNNFATSHGYQNFGALIEATAYKQDALNLLQSSLGTNELQSKSDMWGSSYGKQVAPYVSSATDLIHTGIGLAGSTSHVLLNNALRLKLLKGLKP